MSERFIWKWNVIGFYWFQNSQNNTGEVNQTGDGFFPSIFNEDDLQLMDMAITDSNFLNHSLLWKFVLIFFYVFLLIHSHVHSSFAW